MKKKSMILFVLSLVWYLGYSQPCSDEIARSTKGKWQETDENNYSDPNMKGFRVFPELQKKALGLKQIFVSFYPDPIGCEVTNITFFHENNNVDFDYSAAYNFELTLRYYICDDDNKVAVEEYTEGAQAGIYVNTFRTFLNNGGDPSSTFEIDGKMQDVFMLPPPAGKIKGYKVYQLSYNKAILFTHDNKLPFKTLTREQFLNGLMKEFNNAPGEVNSAVDELEADLKQQLADVDKNFEGEMREVMRKELQNAIEEVKKQRTTGMNNLNQGLNEEKAEIEKYLASHSREDLQQPACVMTTAVFRGFFTEEEGGQYLIVRDENYIKRNLPMDAAQMILLEWNSDGDPIGDEFVKKFEANFPFEKIQSAIDK